MGLELNKAAEERAERAAESIREYFGNDIHADTAVLFTTGLNRYVSWHDSEEPRLAFEKIRGFEDLEELGEVERHERVLSLASIGCVPRYIWCLEGRVHLNENPFNDGPVRQMVRLQIDMLAKLGVKVLILTSVVGSCCPPVMVGQIGVAGNFLSNGETYTGSSGEFVGIIDALHPALQRLAFEQSKPFETVPVTHYFWKGPHIESPKQKDLLAMQGAHVVGMSCQPEAEAAARQGMKVLALAYVVNGYIHSHEAVLDVVDRNGFRWMAHLTEVIMNIPNILD